MRKILTLFFAVLVAGAALHGPTVDARADDRDRCQVWSGKYFYRQGSNRAPVRFRMNVVVSRGRMLGFVTEPNTFGNNSSRTLHATIRGTVRGRVVRWTKTYDGTGGVSHSVRYRGRLDRTRRQIRGRWRISNNSKGRFVVNLR